MLLNNAVKSTSRGGETNKEGGALTLCPMPSLSGQEVNIKKLGAFHPIPLEKYRPWRYLKKDIIE